MHVNCVCVLQELTEKKSLLSETEMKCRNLQAALSHTQALIKVSTRLLALYVIDGILTHA